VAFFGGKSKDLAAREESFGDKKIEA